MNSLPGQRKPIISRTTWVERALPFLVSLAMLLVVVVWRAVEAVR